EAEDLIPRVTELPAFAKSSGAGIVLDMIEPYKAFQAAPFEFPKSIGRMRLHFTLQGAEDYRVVAEAWDTSLTQAAEHARFLEQRIDAFELDLPGPLGSFLGTDKIRLVGDTSFEARGSKIHAEAAISHKQLKRIIGFIQSWLDARAEAARAEAEKAAEERKKKAEERKKKAEELKKKAAERRREAEERRKKAIEARRKRRPAPPNAGSTQ